jgi:hypothetical protein
MPDQEGTFVPESFPSTPVPRVPVVSDLPGKVLAVKEGETFLYSDIEGNLDDRVELGLGLYHTDTRFLSHFRLRVAGRDPILLSSSAERVYVSHVDLTNPDLYEEDRAPVAQHTLNIRRIRAIRGRLYERIRMKNYNPHPLAVDLRRQLARRRHDQCPRHASRLLAQALHDRQQERRRLAAAGHRGGEHVAALERDRDRLLLDRRRAGEAERVDGAQQVGVQPEIGKALRIRRASGRGRNR